MRRFLEFVLYETTALQGSPSLLIALYHTKGALSMAKSKNEIQRDYEKRTGYAAQNKYNKERTVQASIRLIIPKDNDILEKLDAVPSKAGYIKQLIRADIATDQTKEQHG